MMLWIKQFIQELDDNKCLLKDRRKCLRHFAEKVLLSLWEELNIFFFFYVYVVRLQSSFFRNTNVSYVSETKNAPFEQATLHFYFFTSFSLPQLGGTKERRRTIGQSMSHYPESSAVGRNAGGAETTASNLLIWIKF